MSFSPTITQASEVLPGVSFTLHRIGLSRRAAIDDKTLKDRQRLRELELEYPPQTPKEEELAEQLEIARKKVALLPDDPKAQADLKAIARDLLHAATLETRQKRDVINEEYATVQGRIRLAWIQAGLVSISGGEVDSMTPEQLLEYGPIDLAQEIYQVLTGTGRLAGPDAKNSSSPGTSGAPDSQAMISTTAGDVNGPGPMPGATASAIFQNA